MKTHGLLAVLLSLCLYNCTKEKEQSMPVADRRSSTAVPAINCSLQDSVQAIINRYAADGIPGIQVLVKNRKCSFALQAGVTRVENGLPMAASQPNCIESITKTFTATLVMKQVDRGALFLDHSIDGYLPKKISDSIRGSHIITVRMLLNHTSGIVNVSEQPEFIEAQTTDPLHQPSFGTLLHWIAGKELLFAPGTDFHYSNSNYLLLQVILETLTHRSYEDLLRNDILLTAGLQDTYYRPGKVEAAGLRFPNYYFTPDASSSQLANGTAWNLLMANASYGFGGIVCKPADVIRFYHALVNGRLVSRSSFAQMTTWIQGREATEPEYGLGLEYFQYAPGTPSQYGHEGDGIGCSTQLLYVPATDTYLYLSCNVGRVLDGPFVWKIPALKTEVCKTVAGWR